MNNAEPGLKRSLTLWPLVIFGLAFMTPMIVLITFGVMAHVSRGATPAAYILCTFAMLFTAYSYGVMVKHYPVAGSAYTYARRTIDSRVGFLVGWAVLLDYLFLPMVIWLIGAAYLVAQFPAVPEWLFLVAFIVITSIVNILGTRSTVGVSTVLGIFQILLMVFFVILSLLHVGGTGNPVLSMQPFFNDGTSMSAIVAGAALGVYSFIGFDGLSTFTEETIDPTRTLPKAIMLSAVFAGIMYTVVSYTTQLVHPGFVFENVDSAAFEIAKVIGGNLFGAIFLAGIVIAQFTAGVAVQAGTARLMYAMGRDEVFPKKAFGYLHPRFRTPAFCIALCGAVGLVALLFDNVLEAASFINFGAFTAFTMVNVSVVFFYFRNKEGAAGRVFTYVVVPSIGALVSVFMLFQLDATAIKFGFAWLALGLVYLVFLTRMFTKEPPEMTFVENAES